MLYMFLFPRNFACFSHQILINLSKKTFKFAEKGAQCKRPSTTQE